MVHSTERLKDVSILCHRLLRSQSLGTTGLGKGCNYRRELILLVTRIGSKNFEVRLSFIYISTIRYSRDRLKDLTVL
jgi:hypothetical protein